MDFKIQYLFFEAALDRTFSKKNCRRRRRILGFPAFCSGILDKKPADRQEYEKAYAERKRGKNENIDGKASAYLYFKKMRGRQTESDEASPAIIRQR